MRLAALLAAALLAAPVAAQEMPWNTGTPAAPPQPGLLFYASGDKSFHADYSAGNTPDPNYQDDVRIQPNGVHGSYMQCGDNQRLAWWAPGNIYAQRGTLSFYWRPRTPVDATEFPVFRVGFGDHSSWDMVWLRIDYNGHGFDAFVTDTNLGRTRVSTTVAPFPSPDTWTHLALTWDETEGIRFYINGKLAASAPATGPFDTALDQFGPHSRLIAPTGVESSYNYDRGGDIDELRIYDRALSTENIASLARNEIPASIPAITPNNESSVILSEARSAKSKDLHDRSSSNAAQTISANDPWLARYGWSDPAHLPAPITAPSTIVRKVEIHDAYDLKRWWWKGTDGIPETTWPGVYNRSRLPGRFDYFQLPDWDTYSLSGQSVTFYLPDEPWNHLEVRGGAWGHFDLLTPGNGNPAAIADPDQHDPSPQLATRLADKPPHTQRFTFDTPEPTTGHRIRFTNAEQEWPIAEFAAYYVHPGAEPTGVATLRYHLTASSGDGNPSVSPVTSYITDRYPAGERETMIALPDAAAGDARNTLEARRTARAEAATQPTRPILHLIIPADFRATQQNNEGHGATYSWENMRAGLDGIAIDLPALNLPATNGLIPLNIQVHDPLWPMRLMLDFSFSVKPGEPHTLWLDTRDRILPNGQSLYLTIASASPQFNTAALEGAHLRLIFKRYEDALPEHIADRLTQVRDNYANMVEESVASRKLNLFNRFDADITDLLRVDPTNKLGLQYWNEMNHEQIHPPFTLPPTPQGVPAWAVLQTEDLKQLKSLINWYVDNRQISDGEIGGGLSDDSDFFNWWPGLAMMGSTPDKLKASILRGLESMWANGMMTDGLATAQYDELHSYEDGINTLGQSMMLAYGSPRLIERAMENAHKLEWLTGINSAGQRQIRSSYFSATKMSENGVWGWAKERSYMVFHPTLALANFNGNPTAVKLTTEVADGMLAHFHADTPNGTPRFHFNVEFHTNKEAGGGGMTPWFMLWGAYKFTGDTKYIAPFDADPLASMRFINADALDILNKRDTWGKRLTGGNAAAARIYSNVNSASETNQQFLWQLTGDTSYLEKLYASQLETADNRQFINREGSLWIDRIYYNNGELQRARLGGVALMRNYIYPGNVVSWRFDGADDDTSVAILVPIATPGHIRIQAYNLSDHAITAQMTGWEVNPGTWQMTSTVAVGVSEILGPSSEVSFERSKALTVSFAPHATTNIELTLKTPGVPYWSRPDLGLDPEDVHITHNKMTVTVHSVGATDAPASKLILRDAAGKTIASAAVPALKAPTDLLPKKTTVTLTTPAVIPDGATLTIELAGPTPEITLLNNTVTFPLQLPEPTRPPRFAVGYEQPPFAPATQAQEKK